MWKLNPVDEKLLVYSIKRERNVLSDVGSQVCFICNYPSLE